MKKDDDDAAKAMDCRLEQLLILILLNSALRLHRSEDHHNASQDDLTATAAKEDMSLQLDDQAAISRELMIVAQRLIDVDAQLLDLRHTEDKTQTHMHMPSLQALKTVQSSLSSVSSDQQQQLMRDNDEAATIKKKKSKAAYRKNKAAAKRRRRKKTNRMSWLSGAAILPQIIMMAIGSITTLIVTVAITHQSVDGSSEIGAAAPALPPTVASKSLLRRSTQHNQHPLDSSVAAATPSTPGVINDPSISNALPPFLLSATSPSDLEDTSTFSSRRTQETCLDTPNWKDKFGDGCDWYEEGDDPGCPNKGNWYVGIMGSANENCCHCGGGSDPTISPTISASPSLSSSPTDTCLDTPNWKGLGGFFGCDWYEEYDVPGCPKLGDLWVGEMGSALENCCYCGGGSATLPPTISPTISASPTLSSSPTEPPCLDTPNWKDRYGNGCDWYGDDNPGCPTWGDSYTGDMGPASEHCCNCGGGSATLPPTISPYPSASPTLSSSPTELPCFDTPHWKDSLGRGCDWYERWNTPGCPYTNGEYTGVMGKASENCCYCGGGARTCEGYRSICQNYFSVLGDKDGNLTELCKEAESCSCDGTTHDFEIITDHTWQVYTVGLYDECKCDHWLRLCEDTGEGVACDYAAEYCCGDYNQVTRSFSPSHTSFLNSPTCYCNFFNYVQNQFDHTLKPQTLSENIANGRTQFSDPCDQYFGFRGDEAIAHSAFTTIINYINITEEAELEVISLKAIYEQTNGQNWINNSGWMNGTVPHCQWYGISCNDDRLVIGIDLRRNNLSGQFPVYTYANPTYLSGDPALESEWLYAKYGLANLFYLETLDLADNHLTGTIDFRPLYNLKSLHHFDISGNQLSGGFDPLITPSISYANFSNNRFTSMHRFQPFKVSPLQTLRSLDLSKNNEIKIDATDLLRHIPQDIEQFVASNNGIYGKLPPSLNNLSKLRRFDMSFNALSGVLPVFENSRVVLQELDLSNQDQANGLTGPIPEELWRLQFLKVLNLAGNKLTGNLPPDIINLAVLRTFDVSNNSLSGEIPPQIGQLAGTLNHLGLVNNRFSGIIPSELGDLRGASVLVSGDSFDVNLTAPLSLCSVVRVKYSDLADDTNFCPMERNALSNFYDSAKGGEWTNSTNWNDEYTSHCDWHGVECDENEQVIELNLNNNGLSGRLSSSIGILTFLTKLDLSDNDIKGSIPTDIGLLTQLKYLRLSYNAFTGTAPEELADLTNLQLIQLQSNRITGMPDISSLDESVHGDATFVADCGVPSAFENALECDNCTMCCNANEDCYPQAKSQMEKWGYSSFASIVFVLFTLLCCMIVFFLSRFREQQRSASTLTISMQEKKEQDDDYALSRVGKDSVYSYFVTDLRLGWLCAFVTLVAQALILIFFVLASEVKLQDDKTDIEFTWKCPRDTDVCDDKSDLEDVGWFIFCLLMVAFLAKDLINGSKLIYHSSKARHTFWPRIRYFVGGLSLCTITIYALYVSIVYNNAIATSNTDIILNSVVVLFIMDMDEVIFAAIEAWNEKWTAHVGKSEDARSDSEEADGGTSTVALEELRRDIAAQDEKIAAQQGEITMLRKTMEQIQILQSYPATTTTPVTSPESISQYGSSDESVVSPPANEGRQDNAASVTCNLFGDNNLNEDEEVRAIQTQHDHGLSNSKPNFAEQEAVTEEFEQLE